MQYAFAPHEANFRDWCTSGYPGIPEKSRDFLRHLDPKTFTPPLWAHQYEAIRRCVYGSCSVQFRSTPALVRVDWKISSMELVRRQA